MDEHNKSNDKVKWDHVNKWIQREGLITKWKAYGMPEAQDPFSSRFVDVAPMPIWDIPPKIMISTAITGAFFSKRSNPNQPITPDEIRQSAEECILAGAPNIHIHVIIHECIYKHTCKRIYTQIRRHICHSCGRTFFLRFIVAYSRYTLSSHTLTKVA